MLIGAMKSVSTILEHQLILMLCFRAGTTALWRLLNLHPDVKSGRRAPDDPIDYASTHIDDDLDIWPCKEMFFYLAAHRITNDTLNMYEYYQLKRDKSPAPLVIDATPYYISIPFTPFAIKHLYGNQRVSLFRLSFPQQIHSLLYHKQRIMITLRDPLERLYSDMRYSNLCADEEDRQGDLRACADLASSMIGQFEAFEVANRSLSKAQFWIQSLHHIPTEVSSYTATSFYDAQIDLWYSLFPIDDFCIVSQVSACGDDVHS